MRLFVHFQRLFVHSAIYLLVIQLSTGVGRVFFAPLKSISKMNANKDKGISLLHNISLNDKDKLNWIGTFQAWQMFVEEGLNISNGIWSSPGGDAKQFKAIKI